MSSKPSSKPLYRSAALAAHRPRWMGDILLIQPVSYKVYTLTAVILALCLVLILTLGSYTRRTTVTGMLVPDVGMVRVTSPQAGVLSERLVQEGQAIQRGDVLFRVSAERQLGSGGLEAQFAQQLRYRNQLLSQEILKMQRIKSEESLAKQQTIKNLRQELERLKQAEELQKNRLRLAALGEQRYQELSKDELVSKDQYEQRMAERLDQSSRVSSIERDLVRVKRELDNIATDEVSVSLKYDNQISQMEREIAGNQQELLMSEGRQSFQVLASESGVATAPLVSVGQSIEAGKLLLSLVPTDSTLIAHLYAPTRSTGFVKPGMDVRLRLQSYPYQKFGQVAGKVLNISRTSLLPAELNLGQSSQNQEPLYVIAVEIEKQTILAYGEQQALQAGMLLEADLMSEERKLYEWALEPLFSLSNKF